MSERAQHDEQGEFPSGSGGNSEQSVREVGSVEVVAMGSLVRVTVYGLPGTEATALLHPSDADQLAGLLRGAAVQARSGRS